MKRFLKILFFSAFIRKRRVKIFNLKVTPKFFDNLLIKDYKKKRIHYFVCIVCALIHINLEQCIICGVLFRFFVKLLNNFLMQLWV